MLTRHTTLRHICQGNCSIHILSKCTAGQLSLRVLFRFVTLRAVSKACMLWRLSMTDLQV